MLKRIFIQNFALIDALDIELHKGLQVITGETGAGKSIILGALRLIMGERADMKSINNVETKSVVEAEFAIYSKLKVFFDEHDLDFEQNTIIRREILPSGKSRAFINDVPCTLDVLKQLSAQLIDIHSQFETSHLFNEEYQLSILDGLAGNKALLSDYQNTYVAYKALIKQLADLENKSKESKKDADYKNFLLEELLEENLDEINLEELQSRLTLQENAEKIKENLALFFQRIDRDEVGLLDGFLDIQAKLSKAADYTHQLTELRDRLESIFVEFKDVVFELQNKAESIETNAELIEELQQKINRINELLTKHGVLTIDDLIEIREQLSREQQGSMDLESQIQLVKEELAEKEKMIKELSGKLTAQRKNVIPIFTQKMENLLQRLGMEKAKIKVDLSPSKDYGAWGKDHSDIVFQANAGFDLKPIQSAISGGERSRVMLAIKKIMAENAELPTLILDEIDTGVSGKVAAEMGKLMQEIAQDMQLIVITHLAQVAAKGNDNYKVLKSEVNKKTQSTIVRLSPEEKLKEIAQLLSGDTITKAALEQARELMK